MFAWKIHKFSVVCLEPSKDLMEQFICEPVTQININETLMKLEITAVMKSLICNCTIVKLDISETFIGNFLYWYNQLIGNESLMLFTYSIFSILCSLLVKYFYVEKLLFQAISLLVFFNILTFTWYAYGDSLENYNGKVKFI